jgi:predicted nuclease of predicted toxin-antitoxin system
MRILIDECIDERLRNHLPDQDCQTVRYTGLAGLKNGDLLTAAESAEFDAFLTLDQGIEYQQNLIGRKIAIVVFRAKSSRLKHLLLLIPACLTALESIQAGQLVEIESNGR